MGVDYSTDSGYGFIIPESLIENIEAQHEDDDYWDGFGEWLDNYIRDLGPVSYLTGGSYYSGELSYAVVADGTTQHHDMEYDTGSISYVDESATGFSGNPDTMLRRVAHILGIEEEVKLGWLKSFLIS